MKNTANIYSIDLWSSLIGAKLLSTTNRLFIGLFGILMFPFLIMAIVVYLFAFIVGTPCDIDGIREPVAGSLLYGNNILTAGLIPSSNAIGLHFYPVWSSLGFDEWLYNGGPYQLVALHFLGAVFGSLVTSTLLSETARHLSLSIGYTFGQEDETYAISAAHGYFGRLIFQYASFNNSRSLHFLLAGCPVIGIWFTGIGVSTMAFNLNGFNFNESIIDPSGHLINSWADIMNRADLGMELMHERNAHNFPLDLA